MIKLLLIIKIYQPVSSQKSLVAFSFDDVGAKEKAIKKKNAERKFSRSAEREEVQNEQARFAPSLRKLLKKFDQNFYSF